jgi:hypothetical protein
MNAQRTLCTLAACLALIAPAARAGEAGSAVERAKQWELAGLNREWAAANQEAEGEALLVSARAQTGALPVEPNQRKAALKRAADACKRAGDLFVAASRNLEHAALNWSKAAGELDAAEMTARARTARAQAADDRAAAEVACEKAAGAYEESAGRYQADALADMPAAAGAGEKAAGIREKLATLK